MMSKTGKKTAYRLELCENDGREEQQTPTIARSYRRCGLPLKTGIRGGVAFELDAIEMDGSDLNGPTRKG